VHQDSRGPEPNHNQSINQIVCEYTVGQQQLGKSCCPGRHGSNMKRMGIVKIDSGHGEDTRHIFGTSLCEHTKSIPYSVYFVAIHEYATHKPCVFSTLAVKLKHFQVICKKIIKYMYSEAALGVRKA